MKILHRDEAEKAEAESIDGDDDDEEEEEEQDGLKAFEKEDGDCKLVLIVRTDLGMNKGSTPCAPSFPHSSQAKNPPPPSHRQNRRPSLPRHTVQLQSPHITRTPSPAITAVGIHRASENRCAGQIRRAA